MVGLLFLWLCIEAIAPDIAHRHIALFSDNFPMVSWVDKMALQRLCIAAQLVRTLALQLNIKRTCLLTPVHITGVENALTDIPSCSFGNVKEWECKTDNDLLTLFNQKFPLPNQALWTVFPFCIGMTTHMTSTLRMRGITLAKWQQLPKIENTLGKLEQICPTSGVGPFLTGGVVHTNVHVLTGFVARVCKGLYGRGKRVQTGTVVGALTAVGQEIALACGETPTKVTGSKKLLPRLQQIYDGWRKEDPPTTKQLPVEANVPELLAEKGRNGSVMELERAIGGLSLIAFYYLLHIGEYTVKGTRNITKQTIQFKYEDITFFKKKSS
jgi:hypothetical protein